MTKRFSPLFRVLPIMLFCLTLMGAAAAAASNGPVVGWGRGASVPETPPDTVNGVAGTATGIAAGGNHSCAIQAGTGNVVCWGQDWYSDQATPPDDVNGVAGTATAIAAGYDHNCAIQDGTGNVVCWGYDGDGKATPPDAVNGVAGTATAIGAGSRHNCAIQAGTGNVVCWGYDGQLQATPPDTVNGVAGTATAIAAGRLHTLAIAVPEPTAWLAQTAGLALLCALHRSRACKRRRLTVPL